MGHLNIAYKCSAYLIAIDLKQHILLEDDNDLLAYDHSPPFSFNNPPGRLIYHNNTNTSAFIPDPPPPRQLQDRLCTKRIANVPFITLPFPLGKPYSRYVNMVSHVGKKCDEGFNDFTSLDNHFKLKHSGTGTSL